MKIKTGIKAGDYGPGPLNGPQGPQGPYGPGTT